MRLQAHETGKFFNETKSETTDLSWKTRSCGRFNLCRAYSFQQQFQSLPIHFQIVKSACVVSDVIFETCLSLSKHTSPISWRTKSIRRSGRISKLEERLLDFARRLQTAEVRLRKTRVHYQKTVRANSVHLHRSRRETNCIQPFNKMKKQERWFSCTCHVSSPMCFHVSGPCSSHKSQLTAIPEKKLSSLNSFDLGLCVVR